MGGACNRKRVFIGNSVRSGTHATSGASAKDHPGRSTTSWRAGWRSRSPESPLMLGPEEVPNGLHGVENRERDFDEHRVPPGHPAIPEPGPLERPELAAVRGFLRHDHRLRVDEASEV